MSQKYNTGALKAIQIRGDSGSSGAGMILVISRLNGYALSRF
jgi:hypothetical protein